MSEAELHLLKQRMLAGKQAKARRGELAIALPTGYVRRPSGGRRRWTPTSRSRPWCG
jgi:DNA invertase Pin-like site-specific DNA recombinase